MRVTLRQARLAAAGVVAAVVLYGSAGPVFHLAAESDRAPLHGLGICLVLFAAAGSFFGPRPSRAGSTRVPVRFTVTPAVLAPSSRSPGRHTAAWLQRFLN